MMGVAALGLGCGPSSELIEQADGCPAETGDPTMGERSVRVGDGLPPGFVPYVEAGSATLIVGPQGGTMITPVLRVEAKPGETEGHCWRTTIKNTYDPSVAAPEDADGLVVPIPYVLSEGAYYSDGAVWDLFSYDATTLRGSRLTLSATVEGADFTATETVKIDLQ